MADVLARTMAKAKRTNLLHALQLEMRAIADVKALRRARCHKRPKRVDAAKAQAQAKAKAEAAQQPASPRSRQKAAAAEPQQLLETLTGSMRVGTNHVPAKARKTRRRRPRANAGTARHTGV